MLKITLGNRFGVREALPEIGRVRAVGAELRCGPEAQILLGEYAGRAWKIKGRVRSTVEIEGPLVIAFESRGTHAAFGPYPNLLIVGDAIFAGGSYLARYDTEDRQWHLNEAEPWSAVVISALRSPAQGGAERAHMIQEAAYYRAEKRGFAPGGELNDWLGAERHAGEIATCPSCHHRWLLADDKARADDSEAEVKQDGP